MVGRVVTANRLRDGRVVYLDDGGGWSEQLAEARVAHLEEQGAALLARAERAVAARQVVEPYLIDVGASDGMLRPIRYRESIRALGPSVRPDLGKQAEEE